MNSPPPEKRGFPFGLTVAVLVAFVILIGLGVWQVRRLQWKTDLLNRIAALQAAPAQPLGAVLQRRKAGADVDYTRVEVSCPDLETRPVVHLFAVFQGLAGYRPIAACPLASGPYGSVLVDRGFVGMPGDDQPRDLPGRPISEPIVGVLRSGGGKTFVTPQNHPAQNQWYWRDAPAMARQLGASNPAPTFLMLERPAPSSGEPRQARTR